MNTDDDDNVTTEMLFQRALEQATSDAIDDNAYWAAIYPLQRRGPKEVWALVAPRADHPDARLRALVPDVLRFLGGRPQPLLDETVVLLKDMLGSEQPALVISAVATAFVDLKHPSAVDILSPFVAHPDAGVREALVHGLLPVAECAVPELVQLSRDVCAEVRNWATFGLGSQLGERGDPGLVDTPEVRVALLDRLADPHAETRAEAALGLAIRGDDRAIPLIQRELQSGTQWIHYVEAAELLADVRLYEALVTASETGKAPADLTHALAACNTQRG